MNTESRSSTPLQVSNWGSKPLFAAYLGSMLSTVLIRRTRNFRVGQKVEFCPRLELRGNNTRATPPWRHGVVTAIEDGTLTLKAA